MIGIIGDIHAHFGDLFEVIEKHSEIDVWLQVGDLGSEDTHYPEFPVPFYFISGNHENWDDIEKIDKGQGPKNLHHIKNGETAEIEKLKILGFGGNFSPVHSIFHPESKILTGSRRRHNTHRELYKASLQQEVDILICHEPPQPYVIRGKECGIRNINELLIKVKPKLCFFGHHHYRSSNVIEGITCIGLDYGWKSFISMDPDDVTYEVINL